MAAAAPAQIPPPRRRMSKVDKQSVIAWLNEHVDQLGNQALPHGGPLALALTQAMAAWPTVVDRQQVVTVWRQYRKQQDPNGLLINVDVTSDHDTRTQSVLISVGDTRELAVDVIKGLISDENGICMIGPRFMRFARAIGHIADDNQLCDDAHTIISSLIDRWASALAINHASKAASVDVRERRMGIA